jgi:1-phosphatidylinositol-4-phosphate 5-kinase
MSRRNTNPAPSIANGQLAPRSPLQHSHSTLHASPRQQTIVPGTDGAALDSDILAYTEMMRKERLERRQKKMSVSVPVKAEDGSPLATVSAVEGELRDKAEAERVKDKKVENPVNVLVGNLIGEDHVNYVLMYNMLTGIRIGVSYALACGRRADLQVSRCQAKIKRPLTDEDYLARHKFSFDM